MTQTRAVWYGVGVLMEGTMTPQQLIDLSGYGSAENQLRKMGKWKLTPQEEFQSKLSKVMGSIDGALCAISDAENDLDNALSDISKTQTYTGVLT